MLTRRGAGIAEALRTRTFAFAAAFAVALYVANVAVQPSFTQSGLSQTVANLAPFALAAMATAPSVLVGGLDLSVGPVLTLSNVVMVTVLLPHGLGDPAVAIPIVLALGAASGALSGALMAYVRVPSIITGVCALFVITGVAQQIQLNPRQAPANWTDHLAGGIGPIPAALIPIAAVLVVWLLLRRTPLVRSVMSVGGDALAAFSAGVDVAAARVVAYALGGMIAALGGLALTAVIRSADSSLGLQYTLVALAAVSLGGTPVGGGRGGLVGPLLGAICVYLVQNLLSGLSISSQWLNVVYGCVLILAVVFSALLTRSTKGAAA